MKWRIVTDSSCDDTPCLDGLKDVEFAKVPFIIRVGAADYLDSAELDVPAMLHDMETCQEASRTSCPTPFSWAEQFEQAENTIAITISGNLSGSYNSAMFAREMVLDAHPEKQIFVLDSCGAGSTLSLYAQKAAQWIAQGLEFDQIVKKLRECTFHTVFALASFNNLIKNGRMSKLAGFVAGRLGLWGIGIGTPEGKIKVKGKVLGIPHVISGIVNDMKEHCFACGNVVISHCQNLDLAEKLRDRIIETWNCAKVKILPTGGLCSFYAERKGLIVAY